MYLSHWHYMHFHITNKIKPYNYIDLIWSFHRMKRFAAMVAMSALLTACNMSGTSLVPTATTTDSSPKEGDQDYVANPSFSQFTDIPVPPRSEMDTSRTLLLGSQDKWIGRLVFSSGYSVSQLFDFYKQEMPAFGWTEITTVRSELSVLTYKRQGRIATIQLSDTRLNNSEVQLTVSPEGAGTSTVPR
jgi:hypothetical protein